MQALVVVRHCSQAERIVELLREIGIPDRHIGVLSGDRGALLTVPLLDPERVPTERSLTLDGRPAGPSLATAAHTE